MAGLIVLVVIAIGLYNRGGRRFEWSRRSLLGAAGSVTASGERILVQGVRALPAVAGQCIIDMRALFDDTMGLIDPKARRRIEERARDVMARGADRRRNFTRAGRATLATGGQSNAAQYQSLQKSYLEGSITLERYVEEAQRLRPPS